MEKQLVNQLIGFQPPDKFSFGNDARLVEVET
jgi:hypothetical protein